MVNHVSEDSYKMWSARAFPKTVPESVLLRRLKTGWTFELFWKWPSSHLPNIYPSIPIYTYINPYIPILSQYIPNIYQFIPIYTNICLCKPIYTSYIPIQTQYYPHVPINTHMYPIYTHTYPIYTCIYHSHLPNNVILKYSCCNIPF